MSADLCFEGLGTECFIRLRRRPRLRAETVTCPRAFGEDMHFGVQARALPVDECGLRS